MRRRIAVLVIGFLSAGFAAGDESADVLKRQEAQFARAVAERDLARFRLFLAEDLRTFPGGEAKTGPDAMEAAWAPFFREDGPRIRWTPERAEIAASGDLGYTTGTYELSGRDPSGTPWTKTGSYVTIWRKSAEGHWKAALDIGTPPGPSK
jgi:ketosteroid isomerase-like protein